MYAQTHSITDKSLLSTKCTIQIGLAPGIPYITYFGDSSSNYNRTREKIPFIFSFVGKKLPKRKIKVNFSSDVGQVKDSHVDLAVLVGIYLASNDIGLTGNVYCFGEVDMNGKVKNASGIENMLWSCRDINTTDHLFLPEGNSDLYSIYNTLPIIPISHLSQVFKYFEGSWEPKPIQKAEISNEIGNDRNIPISSYIALRMPHNTVILEEEDIGERVESNYLSTTIEESKNSGMRINSLINSNSGRIDHSQHHGQVMICGNEELLFLLNHQELVDSCEKLTTIISDINFEELKQPQFRKLHEFISSKKWIISLKICKCERSKGKCICNTRELHRHQSILKLILDRAIYLITPTITDEECELLPRSNLEEGKREKIIKRIEEKLIRNRNEFLESL